MNVKRAGLNGASWDSVILASVKIVTTLASIAQTKILSVGLSLSDYGTWSQVNLVVSICATIAMLGFGDGVNYFFNGKSRINAAKRQKYVNTLFALETGIGLMCAAGILLFRGLLADYFSNDALAGLLMIAAFKPVLENLLYLYQILFVSIGRAKVIALRNLILSALKLCAVFICVNLTKDLAVLIALMLVLDGIQYLIMQHMFSKWGYPVKARHADSACVKPVLVYCLPMGIFALTGMLSREVDKLVVGRLAGTEALAIYANCSKVLPFDMIAGSFVTVLIPYIMSCVSAGRREKAVQLFRNYLKIGCYTVWIMGAAVLTVHEQAIAFLYSEAYLAGRVVFALYVFDSMIRFAGTHLILTASGQTGYVMACSIFSLIVDLPLNIIMYKLMGITGPAVSTLIVAAGYVLVIMCRNLRILRARPGQVVDLGKIITLVSGLGLTAIAFGGINRLLLRMGVSETVAMLTVMGGYVLVNSVIHRRDMLLAFREINNLKL